MKLYKRTLFTTIKSWIDFKPSLKDLEGWNHIKISSEELKRWIFLKPAESVKDAVEKLHYKV
jgi:hypothetical protein